MVALKIVLVSVVILIALVLIAATTFSESDAEYHSWTKAICAENYCIDVQIMCEGEDVVDIKPIPEGVYFSSKWQDPRGEGFRDKWC